MEPRFVTIRDIVEAQRRDLFEIVDNEDHSCLFFILKCEEYGKDVVLNARDTRRDFQGRTLLHSCCARGLLEGTAFLIRLGHEINCIDSSTTRMTPLMEAIKINNLDIAEILLENGASVQYTDINGENALHYAARMGSSRMVKLLLTSSALSTHDIRNCASAASIKLKYPEDLAGNSLCKDVLVNYRTLGHHISISDKKKNDRS